MKAHSLVLLATAVALGTALMINESQKQISKNRRLEPVLGRVEVLRTAYSQWKEAQAEIGGSRSIVLGLEWTKAFSTADERGGGRAKLDLVEGTIDVEVQGMCDGEPLDFWIVENIEGPDRSLAPEPGDHMVRLGRMAEIDGERILHSRIPADLLGSFSLDLVVVTRADRSPAQEGLLFGTPDLFQRLYNKELQAQRNGRADVASGLLLALVAPVDDTEDDGSNDHLDSLVAFGEKLFFNGTFNGNGRTCGSCHPATNNLTLDPEFIATLPESDPLFIAEDRPNHPFPSLVFGTPQSFGRRFENPVLMRGQALILENVDGFAPFIGPSNADRFTMRGVPHVFAQRVSIRAPASPPGVDLHKQRTGWSGDGSPFLDPALPGSNGTLRFFAAGAVRQHFTRDIRRRPGIDFTFPTDAELDAMEAFQLTLGRQQDLNLTTLNLLDAEAQEGKNLFANSGCNGCHAQAGAGVGDPGPDGTRINQNFKTGVERFLTNHPDNTGEPRPPDGGFGTNPQGNFTSLVANPDPTDGIFGNKQFNTPGLSEFADTLPGFHNNITSIAGVTNEVNNTVEGAILFYRSIEFINSGDPLPRPPIDFDQIAVNGLRKVGKFMRVINALHNKDESYEFGKRAHQLVSNPSGFNPATVNGLLRAGVADASDGIEVLLPVGLHFIARQKFAFARQEFEGAMAGSATTRRQKIERGLDALNDAEADMKGP